MNNGLQTLREAKRAYGLNQALNQLQTLMTGLGETHPPTTKYSLDKFHCLADERQMEIVDMINKYVNVLQWSPGSVNEAGRMLAAANEFGMQVLDPRITESLSDGDVVEIYDSEGRQVYRNLTFCRLSSYSLLDVAVNTWQELYERPVASLESIMDQVVEMLSTNALTQSYRVETHVLREKFIYSRQKKTFLIQMKFISPLVDIETGRRSGVVSTCRLKTIADPEEHQGIVIL